MISRKTRFLNHGLNTKTDTKQIRSTVREEVPDHEGTKMHENCIGQDEGPKRTCFVCEARRRLMKFEILSR